MLDHVFTDAIGALRDAFEAALLERQAFEEHFQTDVLLGDLTWETSYGLPGEGQPPRVRPTSPSTGRRGARPRTAAGTSASRSTSRPAIEIEIVLRVQRLAAQPDPATAARDACPSTSPPIGADRLERAGPHGRDRLPDGDLTSTTRPSTPSRSPTRALYELDEETLADGHTLLDEHFGAMGGWISSTLVRLGDLKFDFLPADDDD